MLTRPPSRNEGSTSKAKFCTIFGNFTARKITKFVATRRQILGIKCTKFNFCWGSAPDPAGGAYSSLPNLLGEFKGPTSKRTEGKEKGE